MLIMSVVWRLRRARMLDMSRHAQNVSLQDRRARTMRERKHTVRAGLPRSVGRWCVRVGAKSMIRTSVVRLAPRCGSAARDVVNHREAQVRSEGSVFFPG